MRGIEERLRPCSCGGRFRHSASRRCFRCRAEVIIEPGVDLTPYFGCEDHQDRDPTEEEQAAYDNFAAELDSQGGSLGKTSMKGARRLCVLQPTMPITGTPQRVCRWAEDIPMPIHDWTRVAAGIFHAFHYSWIAEIAGALNRGLLPAAYYALPEQIAGGLGPDVLTLRRPESNGTSPGVGPPDGGVAVAVAPPKVRIRMRSEANQYAAKAKAVTIRHVSNHQVVAMVAVLSPGNKNNQNGLNSFVRKAHEVLAAGIHLLLVDLFPPSARDPQGIHRAVWGDDCGEDYSLPQDKPLTCVAYVGGPSAEAFIELVAIGDALPDMPLFLTPDVYVPVPLEASYLSAWKNMPAYWRDVLTSAPVAGRTVMPEPSFDAAPPNVPLTPDRTGTLAAGGWSAPGGRFDGRSGRRWRSGRAACRRRRPPAGAAGAGSSWCRASSRVVAGVQPKTSVVMTSATVVRAGSRSAPTMRRSRSRSVNMPAIRSCSITMMAPIRFSFMKLHRLQDRSVLADRPDIGSFTGENVADRRHGRALASGVGQVDSRTTVSAGIDSSTIPPAPARGHQDFVKFRSGPRSR